MDLRGYYGGPPRLPLLPPTPEQVAAFRAALENAGQI
jgi:dihydrodipicolinate synthase/N-acetylneuraminate lyase